MREFWNRYSEHYRRNLALAIPVVLSQVGQVVAQLSDNAMVCLWGAQPLAAASFGGSVFFILFIFAVGISLGITPLVGAMYARGEHSSSASCLQNSIVLYTLLGVALFAVQMAIVPFMKHMGQTPEVVEMAIPYYRYLVWSVIPFMLFASFKQFLEGVGNTKVAMVIIITANLTNIFLNWVFIYGHLGAEAMGTAGAGLATLISRIMMPLMILFHFWRKDSLRRYLRMFDRARFSRQGVRMLLTVGLPIAMQMMMEGTAFALSSIMMGWIGAVELAANQIAMTLSNVAFMVVLGISSATTIRVSHEYGVGNYTDLDRASNASYHIGWIWNSLMALLFILFRHRLPLFFTSDPQVVETAAMLLVCAGIFQIFDGMQSISVGVLRGMRDVNTVMGIAFLSYLVINLPLGYLLAFTLGVGPVGLWIGFIGGLAVAALLLYTRYRRLLARHRA